MWDVRISVNRTIAQLSDVFLKGLDPCQIQARPFVTYLPLFVLLALADSSQCGVHNCRLGHLSLGAGQADSLPKQSL